MRVCAVYINTCIGMFINWHVHVCNHLFVIRTSKGAGISGGVIGIDDIDPIDRECVQC
jgi:hypothetical protein